MSSTNPLSPQQSVENDVKFVDGKKVFSLLGDKTTGQVFREKLNASVHRTPSMEETEENETGASSPIVRNESYQFVDKLNPDKDALHDDEANPGVEDFGVSVENIIHNPSPSVLYEMALMYEEGSSIVASGALATRSGIKTGRSPKDKRVVDEESSTDNIWWGPINMKLSEETFMINRERAVDYLNTRDRLFVIDGYAGWDPQYRMKVRIVCERAYHALFMQNMLVRPSAKELREFGEPDFTVYNAGKFPANRYTEGLTSTTCVALNFKRKEMIILGTQYAGEMKKGVFTVMHYFMPLRGVLSLHSSCNVGKEGDVSVFFGLSGTGKTTLSADINRNLVGDDEHCWSDTGVFNIEGGCYAKVINLSREKEPEIFDAIKFGSVLENVVYDEFSRVVDYHDTSLTENTRCSYPIEYIPNALIPCVTESHPSNIILLTCDAFGVLPPVSKLSPQQTMYHFISGYTAKVAGTEQGVNEPVATFSACYGDPFLVWHPTKYASMLAEKLQKHEANAWLVNTGWSGGAYGVGKRMSLKYTRAIIDAIHSGELQDAETTNFSIFNLSIPVKCSGVPDEMLDPESTWEDKKAYLMQKVKLAKLFTENFEQYTDQATDEMLAAGPTFE